MEVAHDTPLDEIVWRSPQDLQNMGALHTNTILHYFARSPFFDTTSNNAILTTQATFNPNMVYLVETRAAFEGRLKTMQGLEFMVAEDPSENDTKMNHSGVWVVRKQTRRKKVGQPDEITPLKSYFVVGENIYVAPSVESILQCRLLSTVHSLTRMLNTASALPDFTPAIGHTYVPPVSKNPSASSSLHATQSSDAATLMQLSGTPRPDTQDSSITKGSSASKLAAHENSQSTQLLETSYDLLLRYGNEYMDENPLLGEPGSFKLSKTRDSGLAALSKPSQPVNEPFKPISSAKKAPPPQIQTDLPAETGKKTGVGTAKSPNTPGTGFKRKKERRKSKATGVDDVTTLKASTPQTAT